MFIAIPLANKPTWRSPPWMTVLLIVVNMLIYWGWQAPEDRRVEINAAHYERSGLAPIEIPLYLDHLQRQARTPEQKRHIDLMRQAWKQGQVAPLYEHMWAQQAFRQALLAGEVMAKDDPRHADWQGRRALFTPLEPQPFSWRWAMNFGRPVTAHPETWLTATFLHADVGHLMGNMVFLFLFGFTLEMALGPGLYLLLYLLCGMGASVVSLLSHGGTPGLGLGASGAISGLMAMYVVMYRLQRINFFYMLFFYFNHAKWPAVVMLPVYMAHEALQQWLSPGGVDYMAHLGGLACGAVLMGGLLTVKKLEAPANLMATPSEPSEVEEAKDKAWRLTDALDYAAASQAWGRVARLAPRDGEVWSSWFAVAQHFPASDEFHAAAKGLLTQPAADPAARRALHSHYHTYLKLARPGMRLSAGTLVHLVDVFVKLQAWDDAQHLARALARRDPVHPRWRDTLLKLVEGLVHHRQFEAAATWVPALRTHAPDAPVTQLLLNGTPSPTGS